MEWGLKVNLKKTKVLIFNKGGRIVKSNIRYNRTPIESVRSYKYLADMKF